MKKTSAELDRVQQEAEIRRRLIESGTIRVLPSKPKVSVVEKHQAQTPREVAAR